MKESASNTLQKNIGMPQAIALYIGAVLGSGVLIVPGLAANGGSRFITGVGIYVVADFADGLINGSALC